MRENIASTDVKMSDDLRKWKKKEKSSFLNRKISTVAIPEQARISSIHNKSPGNHDNPHWTQRAKNESIPVMIRNLRDITRRVKWKKSILFLTFHTFLLSWFFIGEVIATYHFFSFLDIMFFSLILIDTLAGTQFEIDRSSFESEYGTDLILDIPEVREMKVFRIIHGNNESRRVNIDLRTIIYFWFV